ncbi:hypothetical protein BDW22DRAFT_851641 [Trametopsis cervina]|nr:hypothetical protein BDW22DRAFT_851641 [Trametopsis cervina]
MIIDAAPLPFQFEFQWPVRTRHQMRKGSSYSFLPSIYAWNFVRPTLHGSRIPAGGKHSATEVTPRYVAVCRLHGVHLDPGETSVGDGNGSVLTSMEFWLCRRYPESVSVWTSEHWYRCCHYAANVTEEHLFLSNSKPLGWCDVNEYAPCDAWHAQGHRGRGWIFRVDWYHTRNMETAWTTLILMNLAISSI